MKLLSVVFLVVLILPVHGQEKAEHPEGEKRDTKPESVTVTVVNQQAAAGETDRPKDQPKGYFKALIAPNNVANVGLFLVGLAGIITAVSTLRKIERQTSATEKTVALQFRPKISIRAMKFDISKALSKTDSVSKWHAVIANTGTSTAYVQAMTITFDCCVEDAGREDIYPLGAEKVGAFILEAGEIKTVSSLLTNARDPVLAGIHFSDTSDGQYVWIRCTGAFVFSDNAKIVRRCGFRRRFDAKTRSLVPDPDTEYEYDDET